MNDQVSTLIAMNQALGKLTEQFGHAAVAMSNFGSHLLDVTDISQKVVHRDMLISAILGHSRGGDAFHRRLGGGVPDEGEEPLPGVAGKPGLPGIGGDGGSVRVPTLKIDTEHLSKAWKKALQDNELEDTRIPAKLNEPATAARHDAIFKMRNWANPLVPTAQPNGPMMDGLDPHTGIMLSQRALNPAASQRIQAAFDKSGLSSTGTQLYPNSSAHPLSNNEFNKFGIGYEEELGKRLKEDTKSFRKGTKDAGSFLERLSGAAAKAGEGLNGIAGLTDGLFRRGLIATMTSADAASPDAYATLTGSFKLLGAVIGKELLPYTVQAAKSLQDAAKGFDGLSPRVKQLLVGTGLGLTALMGAVQIGSKALTFTQGLHNVTGMSYGAMGGIAGGVAIGGAIAGSYIGGMEYMESRRHSSFLNALGAPERYHEDVEPDVVHKSALYQEAKAIKDPEQRRKFLLDKLDQAQRDLNDTTARSNKNLMDVGSGEGDHRVVGLARFYEQLRHGYNYLSGNTDEIDQAKAKAGTKFEEIKDIYGELVQNKQILRSPRKLAERGEQLQGLQGLLLDIQSRNQPNYYNIEDLYKKVQLEALAESPLQQEIRKIQLDQYDALLRIAGLTEQQTREMREAAGLGK